MPDGQHKEQATPAAALHFLPIARLDSLKVPLLVSICLSFGSLLFLYYNFVLFPALYPIYWPYSPCLLVPLDTLTLSGHTIAAQLRQTLEFMGLLWLEYHDAILKGPVQSFSRTARPSDTCEAGQL